MRDNFDPQKVVAPLKLRAAFICSNPDCRCLTIAPSDKSDTDVQYNGVAAHITAASPGGPRYDSSMSNEERSSINNAIFLCANCSTIIDKNNGADYSVSLLKKWKEEHDEWVKSNLNKNFTEPITEVDGTHTASGIGNVTGLHVSNKPVKIMPGTQVHAQGFGNITGTKIGE